MWRHKMDSVAGTARSAEPAYACCLLAAATFPGVITATAAHTGILMLQTCNCLALPAAGRSAVLLAAGERTCRTYLDPQVTFPGSKLQPQHIQGTQWLFVSGYACYRDGLVPKAVSLAKELGVKVAMDLGSWEIVSSHWQLLQSVLQQGVDLCFCNEEEAKSICKLLELPTPAPEAALHHLLQHCATAVVTLGPKGCVAGTHAGSLCSSSSRRLSSSLSRRVSLQQKQQVQPTVTDGQPGTAALQGAQLPQQQQQQAQMVGRLEQQEDGRSGLEIVRQPGVAGVKVVDVTGAGDMFAAG
eukprot:GHUV01039198.1.p1 GENE.GHUV01039198.1~~GHUV01039198.1.p1  ORF type:complete len:299 (+),score=109.28 GHUV01039198.1:103-999(+)